jgi:nicotinate dehydrogenase subunit A
LLVNADASTSEARSLRVNGRECRVNAPLQARLLDVLRDELQLKGTRFGCGANECGACHVLIDGRSVAACDTPLWATLAHQVTTVEGLDARLHQAFVDEQAAQCGYCSSGMLVACAALLRSNPQPSSTQIRQALDGHLCRCGAHNRIVRAVQRAAIAMAA